MVTNTASRSALLFEHVFEKYVDFVEEDVFLDHTFPMYFLTFEIDVFLEHVCVLRTRICSTSEGVIACLKFLFNEIGVFLEHVCRQKC